MKIGELSLFLTDDIYLIKGDLIPSLSKAEKPEEEEADLETELEALIETSLPVAKEPIKYNPVLFICEKELAGLALETFKNLVSKALVLDERQYSVITQDQVTFSSPVEVNSFKIVMFGVDFSGFQTKYKVIKTEKQLVLVADSMELIAENKDLKMQLWTQLQLMFPKTV
jgi:hypothetical protein